MGPVSVLPTMKMAPIPADAAAQLVCDVADGSEKVPGTGIVSIRGEEEGTTAEFVKRLLTARGEVGGKTPKVVRQLPYFGSAIAKGGLIPDPADHTVSTTLEEWLASL